MSTTVIGVGVRDCESLPGGGGGGGDFGAGGDSRTLFTVDCVGIVVGGGGSTEVSEEFEKFITGGIDTVDVGVVVLEVEVGDGKGDDV